MMGEELSGLSVKDLQGMENQLEMSLRGIRMKKVWSYYHQYDANLYAFVTNKTCIMTIVELLGPTSFRGNWRTKPKGQPKT